MTVFCTCVNDCVLLDVANRGEFRVAPSYDYYLHARIVANKLHTTDKEINGKLALILLIFHPSRRVVMHFTGALLIFFFILISSSFSGKGEL